LGDAYVCDHCGEFVKGKPPDEPVSVGKHDAQILLGVVVYQYPVGGRRFRPELCKGCTITAVHAVMADLAAQDPWENDGDEEPEAADTE